MATVSDVSAAKKKVDDAMRTLTACVENSRPDTESYKRLVLDLERAIENLWRVISECEN